MTSHIYFLRHGLPEHDECLRGISDFALTAEGFEQMRKSYERIFDKIDILISSPLLRCSTFSEYISKKESLPLIRSSSWQEINFGEWDGVNLKLLEQHFPEEMKKYFEEPWDYTPPNAESLDQLEIRVNKAFEELIKQYQNKTVLVVTHSAVMRILLMRFLNIVPRSNNIFSGITMPYASLISVKASIFGNKIKTVFNYPNSYL